MDPSRRDLGQRGQNEAAVLKARMRQDQFGRRGFGLTLGRQATPAVMRPVVGKHQIATADQVEVDAPRLPARPLTPPAEIRLDRMQRRKE